MGEREISWQINYCTMEVVRNLSQGFWRISDNGLVIFISMMAWIKNLTSQRWREKTTALLYIYSHVPFCWGVVCYRFLQHGVNMMGFFQLFLCDIRCKPSAEFFSSFDARVSHRKKCRYFFDRKILSPGFGCCFFGIWLLVETHRVGFIATKHWP